MNLGGIFSNSNSKHYPNSPTAGNHTKWTDLNKSHAPDSRARMDEVGDVDTYVYWVLLIGIFCREWVSSLSLYVLGSAARVRRGKIGSRGVVYA